MVIISATLSVGMMNLENCVDSVFANNMPLDVPVVIIAKWVINNFGKTILVFLMKDFQALSSILKWQFIWSLMKTFFNWINSIPNEMPIRLLVWSNWNCNSVPKLVSFLEE